MKLFSLALLLSLLTVQCSSVREIGSVDDLYSEDHLDFKTWNRNPDCCHAEGEQIAVASGGTHSSAAGMAIHQQGGNVIDVAIATAFALAVERPHSLGLGGGGFWIYHLAGKDEQGFVDFRETAPAKASRNMFQDKEGNVVPGLSTVGGLAVATPGFVVGLYDIHQKWGKLPWKQLVAPSIRLAREGFAVYPSLSKKIQGFQDVAKKDPYLLALLFHADGTPLKTGDILKQADLAATLERVAANGKAEFQTGLTARRIVAAVQKRGGILTLGDLKSYRTAYRRPIEFGWKGYRFYSSPPPSAGGVMLAQILSVISGYPPSETQGPEYVHLLTETFKRAYSDRSRFFGDPDFVKEDTSALFSPEYVKAIRSRLNLKKTTPSSEVMPGEYLPPTGTQTSHLSVIDASGSAVSSTLTINGSFGALFAVPGTGVFLNNEMDDFSSKPGQPNLYGLVGGESNAIAPKKRPVSSMVPTLAVTNGKAVLAVGGAGGSRITSAVTQVVLNTLQRYPGDLKRSLFAPRIHHQWAPDELNLEKGYRPATEASLKEKGHTLTPPPFSALVQAVYANEDRKLSAVFDPRDEGGAVAQ